MHKKNKLQENDDVNRYQMDEIESIIEQSTLFLSSVGMEVHTFKVSSLFCFIILLKLSLNCC